VASVGHMQIIYSCTLLQTDKHASTSSPRATPTARRHASGMCCRSGVSVSLTQVVLY